jgi:hypothetical protein
MMQAITQEPSTKVRQFIDRMKNLTAIEREALLAALTLKAKRDGNLDYLKTLLAKAKK